MPEKIFRLGKNKIQQCLIYKKPTKQKYSEGFQTRDSKRYNKVYMNQKKTGVVI